jgi:hypothetical protein
MLYRISVLSLALMLGGCLSFGSSKPTVSATPAPRAEAPRLEPVAGQWEGIKKANLRSGPGTDFNVVGSIRPAQKVQVIGRVAGTDWFAIEDPAGKVSGSMAYVRSDLIFQRPTVQSAAITPAAIPTPLVAGTAGSQPLTAPVPAKAATPPLTLAPAPISAPATTPAPAAASPPVARPVVAAPVPATFSSDSFTVRDRARRSADLIAQCRSTLPASALGTCRELAETVAAGSDPTRGLPAVDRRQSGDFVLTGPGWRGGVLLREANGRWQAFAANGPMSWQIRLARND